MVRVGEDVAGTRRAWAARMRRGGSGEGWYEAAAEGVTDWVCGGSGLAGAEGVDWGYGRAGSTVGGDGGWMASVEMAVAAAAVAAATVGVEDGGLGLLVP